MNADPLGLAPDDDELSDAEIGSMRGLHPGMKKGTAQNKKAQSMLDGLISQLKWSLFDVVTAGGGHFIGALHLGGEAGQVGARGRGAITGFRAIRAALTAARKGNAAAAAEIRVAKLLSAQGRRIHFQTPGMVHGVRTADFLLDGVLYDVYSPITTNASRIISAIAKKNSQEKGVVLDLSRASVTKEQLGNILSRVRGAGATNINDVIVFP